MEGKYCVISLSGGLDSTCLMMYMLSRGYAIKAVSFDYGQTNKIELKRVKKNIEFLKSKGFDVDHRVIDLKSAFSYSASSLTGHGEIPEGHYASDQMKSTVVENRNVIFSAIIYGIALGIAKQNNSNVIITQGVHKGDHAVYPDTTKESIDAAQHLYKISNWDSDKVDFETPFVDMDKGEVLAAGISSMNYLGLSKADIKRVLRNTNTCYNPTPDGKACGKLSLIHI